MELTQTYKHKAAIRGTETSFQKAVMTFVNRHAGALKALTRGGTPYGDNWLSVRSKAAGSGTTKVVSEKQIDSLQQQLNELSQTIALLSDQVNAHKEGAQTRHKSAEATEEIGINRFRALQAEC
ncbi:hypothetical protein [Spirosoma jeollabukense]